MLIVEANQQPGGGMRSAELTLPGFVHDLCSSIHPLAVGSPFFKSLKLDVEWIHPEIAFAHPLDDGAAGLVQSVPLTADKLGVDGVSYRGLMEPFAVKCDALIDEVLQPMLHIPKHPILMAKFGMIGLRSASSVAHGHFRTDAARALFGGVAAHSFLPLDEKASAAMGLVLAILGHGVGWPMPRGGTGKITEALLAAFAKWGGKMETGRRINNIDELPPARTVFFDVTPRQLLAIAGHRFSSRYVAALKKFRYGPGIFKVDYALSAPIPWKSPECRRAGTVHVCGTLEEIERAEREVAGNQTPEKPFVLLAQHSLFDNTRAPAGKHTAWAYCHVPNGSTMDMAPRIEAQIERFAPGFRDCILARATHNCRAVEEKNANLIGGDINGGRANLGQLVARPVLSPFPYRTSAKEIYICSSSTPPGGGVHGMCGFNAAKDALKMIFGRKGISSAQ